LKVDVICDPHVLQSLQEETLLQLPLCEESNKVLLLKEVGKKGDDKSALFGFLHRTTSDFNKFETFLQVDTLYSIIDNLVEVLDLSVSVEWALVLHLIAVFIVHIV
jgi:hypothetical protein